MRISKITEDKHDYIHNIILVTKLSFFADTTKTNPAKRLSVSN